MHILGAVLAGSSPFMFTAVLGFAAHKSIQKENRAR